MTEMKAIQFMWDYPSFSHTVSMDMGSISRGLIRENKRPNKVLVVKVKIDEYFRGENEKKLEYLFMLRHTLTFDGLVKYLYAK
jgi:hypothetical protein